MSLLWRDRLLVSLAPASVALVRVAGRLRPRIVMKQAVACDPAFGPEPWQGAVAALDSLLAPLRRARLDATVVLSNEFVRYAIVPFDAAAGTPEEDLALARFQLVKLHGERARDWDVRAGEGRRGTPRIASAVDAQLVPAVRACFPRSGTMRLVSVQPYLMSAFNRWRAHMKGPTWLLLVEPRRACLALAAGRNWLAVHTARGEFHSAEDWTTLLDRQRLRTDAAPAGGTVLVHAPWTARAPAGEAHGWKFVSPAPPAVAGFLPLEDGPYTMALTAR